MGSLQADIGELAHHLKQERLFLEAEKHQIQLLNEKVRKTIERAYHASWVRGEQQRNYDDLVLRPHSSPPACCQKANLLNQLKFIDGYKVLGFNESLYGDLLSSLRENPRLVARCLAMGESQSQEAMQVTARTVFSSIYANCVLPDDETYVLNLLKHLMELQLATSETPRRLLRHGSCAFSQIYRAYVDTLPQAKVFLTAALHQPIVQLLMEDELFLDIDPSKAAVRFPAEERLRRFGKEGTPEYNAALAKYRAWTIAKLVKIADRFMESIKEAMNCFPPQLSWLVRILYDVLLTAKRADTREVSAICVDLVFAFFLCPALVTPEPHGICDAPISHISRFNLIQVAQILQVLAMSRWETPDHRLSDLYSHFEKEVICGVVDGILESGGSEAPPPGVSCLNSPLSTLVRSSCLIPEPRLHALVAFMYTILSELPEDDEMRKDLETSIGRLKPSHLSPAPPATSALSTPNTAKKNLLGRVKSNRVKANKSQSEGSGDSDSLGSLQESTVSSSSHLPGQSSIDEGDVMPPPLDYDTVLVISLNTSSPPECPGLMSEEKVLSTVQTKSTSRVRMNVEDEGDGGGGEATIEKRTRFSLSHDEGSIGNTSDNLEAISEAASNHSVASSLDDVEQEDQPDNLSDMVSANVSGRGTPNVSGRDTPSSQVTEGEEAGLRSGEENQPPPPNVPVTVPKPARADIEEKFGRFEIKPLIGGDETISLVSDTWSTDVLASDSETIEAADRADRGDQFHDQLLNRHLAELDRMQGDYLSGDATGETFETASEAWSTDVLASDSERMTEFDTDDAQSVARSDDTGRSEVEVELGGSDLLRRETLHQEDIVTPRAHGSRSPVDATLSGAMGGSSSGGILKPMPVLPSSLTTDSGNSIPSGILKPIPVLQHRSGRPATPPRVEFQPIHPAEEDQCLMDRLPSDREEEELPQEEQEIASATQSLGRLSLNLSTLPNNGIVSGDQHLLLNTFIGDGSRGRSNAPLMDLGNNSEGGHIVVHPHHKLVSSDRGSGEDSSLHLSTTSLASSSSSGSDVVGGSGKLRSTSNASSGPTTDSIDTPEPSAPAISMAATGAIPKSISFDKTAERGDRDAIDGDAKHKRGFFKNFKLPGFKGRRKPGSRPGDDTAYIRSGLNSQDLNIRRALSEENRPPTIEETSDDILAKYRNKKPEMDTSETDGMVSTQHNIQVNEIAKTEEDERLFIDPSSIETSYAFADAKRKLRLVLSIADFSMSPYLPEFGAPTGTDSSLDNDVVTWLRCQLAEATNLHDRSLVAQLHETLRCVQLFDSQGREHLVRSLVEDYRSRSPYVAYLVRSRQGLLTTIAHLEKLLSRINADGAVVMSSIVGVCVRMFLERREQNLSRFTHDFTVLTVPDEKVQLVENFLTQLFSELERDPMWISSTNEQLHAAQLALERVVMSHIYIHALYPNGDGDVSRDQVLHEHMKKLAAVITPTHKDLRIPKLYQYECPWPSAQAEIVCISAYKTPGDKLQCVVRASQTIMNLLSLAHDQSVPAADDFMPVLVYVLIKANPPALLSTVQYVNLFFEKRLKGEDQYWWTQFCAAIEFIKTMDYML
ncbi:GTPase-activating protein and VPS9 domain-containing protein 1 isoform X2 [Procambarus clarkii]|uniref:GTPase-activating protein and VPS9 domain-containing protein 1 isoform X2 n=1 Tax=Procambarus clarkii TaxID=6728 RepID=UPI001E677DFE|nr:GTPase-activating protein and VPS9 domain-containing protein 1-like isoform X2 [Procambarus clarkii]